MDKTPSAIRRWRGFYKLKEIAGFSLKGSIYRTLKVINDQLKSHAGISLSFSWGMKARVSRKLTYPGIP